MFDVGRVCGRIFRRLHFGLVFKEETIAFLMGKSMLSRRNEINYYIYPTDFMSINYIV